MKFDVTVKQVLFSLMLASIGLLCACNSDTKKQASSKISTASAVIKFSPPKIIVPPELGFKILGYIMDSRDSSEIPESKFAQCNVVVYACALLLENSVMTVRFPKTLEFTVRRAHRNHCKAFLGVSGEPYEFKKMTQTIEGRSKAINHIMQLVRQYGADGVDLDWEFPTVEEKTDKPFTLFAKQLGDSCHVNGRYYFSCAVAPGVSKVNKRARAIEKELLTGPWVDWFNVMIYDNYSEDEPYVQHSKVAYNSFYYWLHDRKMSKNKCVLGMPLYGRPSGIPQEGHVLTFKTIILKEGGDAHSDSAVIKASKPIGPNDTSKRYTVYYDGIKTVKRKTLGAIKYGGGIMFWELGQDTDDKNSLIAAAVSVVNANHDNRKR